MQSCGAVSDFHAGGSANPNRDPHVATLWLIADPGLHEVSPGRDGVGIPFAFRLRGRLHPPPH
jgi:hypothetical protein